MLSLNNRPPIVFRTLGYVLAAALVIAAHVLIAERAAAIVV